jgi:PPOX class probable F420-dependent enzyme
MSLELSPEVQAAITAGHVAHLTTLRPDGSPHTTIVWVDVDGNDIVVGKLMEDVKVRNMRNDPRVTISIEADGNQWGMVNYLVVEGTAVVTEGGAPELLQKLAHRYIAPDAVFPPMPNPPAGFILRITPSNVRGMGPWGMQM